MAVMHAACRLASVERYLNDTALFVGRHITRATRLLPRLVRRASGLEHPSPEATIAGVVRGLTALAPKAMGGIGGVGIELAGVGAVLALASSTVYAESEGRAHAVLVDAIAEAERRALCTEQVASLWRAMLGVARRDQVLVANEVMALTTIAARSVGDLESFGLRLGKAAASRLLFSSGVPLALRAGLRSLDVGRACAHAWIAMGDAARLVDAMQSFSGEAVQSPRSCAIVLRAPSHAA